MGKTAIAWTEYSWNPIRAKSKDNGKNGWHCTHVTEACRNCYAEALNLRLGTGLEFKPGNRKKVVVYLDENMLRDPIRWHKRQKLKIFLASMTDLFGEFVEDEWIARIFEVIEQCPNHTFQILTKRPERMRKFLRARYDVAPHNVWAGVSISEPSDLRFIDDLRLTNVRVRWLSIEPLLDAIDISPYTEWLKWIVVGGESGSAARSMDLGAARQLRMMCLAARIPYFFKQMSQADTRHYDNPNQFPTDLHVREFPK